MTGALGLPRVHLRRTASTNDHARALAAVGAPHGTLVTAAEQTAGRGRQGRTWSAPAGDALLCSLVLRGDLTAALALLPLAAAVAVAEVAGDRAQIKWPNDVLVDGRKVAGILAEGRPQDGWVVLGVGLNVAVDVEALPPELHGVAGGLGRRPQDVEPALAELLARLEDVLAGSTRAMLDRWRARDALRGCEVSWGAGAASGTAAGIDGDGRLVVRLPGGGQTALSAGEVHLGRDAPTA